MGTPFMGEIKLIAWNFAPKGWSFCDGQFLPINQNQALFSLLGTSYGGDGRTTFALPDLRGRTPIHMGGGHLIGDVGGEAFHTLTESEMPQHLHLLQATSATATTNIPDGTLVLANSAPNDLYTGAAALVALIPSTVSNVGGSQPHENRQPLLALNFIVALQGAFPSRN
jgi:microcystin-dependent protein